MKRLAAGCIAATLCAAACTSSSELIGAARPPTSADQVRLYLEPPRQPYDQIAIVNASSKRSLAFSASGKADVVISRLKEEAAKLGANGIVLQDLTDNSSGSVGTSVGTQYEGARGTADLGLGISAVILQRYGRAIAIFSADQTDLGP